MTLKQLGVFVDPLSNEKFEVLQVGTILTASQVEANPTLQPVVTTTDGAFFLFNEYKTRCGKTLLLLENTESPEFEIAGSNIRLVSINL